MNIHSSYRKLNDYKGASCGQHSALSTQHSALSKIFSIRFFVFLRCLVLIGVCFSSFSAFSIQTCKGESTFPYEAYHPKGFDYSPKPSLLEACKTIEFTADIFEKFKVTNTVEREALPGAIWTSYWCYGDYTYFSEITRKVETINGIGGAADCGCTRTATSIGYIPCSAINLTLSPAPNQKDPRPLKAEGKDGKSTYELIAKVMEGSTPKAGVAVTFKVDVIEKTGGHGHHDANRPKGSVPASGVTEANGEIKITFKAPELAGSHTITATCDSCSNKTVDKKVDVLVPDLAPISPNPSKNADGSYQYAFTAVDPGHVGSSGGRQRGEYYLTAEAAKNLDVLISNFAEEGWGIVGLNDASLNWGGLYDLKNNWNKPHSEHRLGEEIDISFKRAGNIVSQVKQNQFYKKFCEDKKAEVPFSILHHYVLIPHFHVRLANANKCGRTAN